jgi:NhaA family Na+:H+ antiporter
VIGRSRIVSTKLTALFQEFFRSEQASGVILILCTTVAIAIANSPLGHAYQELWHLEAGFELGDILLRHSLEHWINDGLMAVFFLLIGLEIERELYVGELSSWKNASLPIFAALGGMLTPALVHFLFNQGTPTQGGFGIPMATDIAFALGVLALLGSRVPASLKVFLTALAIADDLGAIMVIALFYVGDFSALYLALALGIFGAMIAMNRLGVRRLVFYLIPGVLMWYFMLRSGVHATLAGVLLAFAIPFAAKDGHSPSERLQHFLHRPVAFGIMPVFALANTGISLNTGWLGGLSSPNSIGIAAGLIVGKPVGIILASIVAVRTRISELPADITRGHIIGAGLLGGIGFTMSIFITLLAFTDPQLIQDSKIAILLSSLVAGVAGFVVLRRQAPSPA